MKLKTLFNYEFYEHAKLVSLIMWYTLDYNLHFFTVITLDIDKPIMSMDENGNQGKTEARKTNCVHQITDLPTSFGKFHLLYIIIYKFYIVMWLYKIQNINIFYMSDINTVPFFDENGKDISIITPYGNCDSETDSLLDNSEYTQSLSV